WRRRDWPGIRPTPQIHRRDVCFDRGVRSRRRCAPPWTHPCGRSTRTRTVFPRGGRPVCMSVRQYPRPRSTMPAHEGRCSALRQGQGDEPLSAAEIEPRGTPPPPGVAGARVPFLSAEKVRVSFSSGIVSGGGGGTARAVPEVAVDLAAGVVVALVGEAGCGKTTLARVLLGLERPARGRVVFEGEPL